MGKLSYCMLLLSVTLAIAQETTIDPKVPSEYFVYSTEATGKNLEKTTVKPTDTPTILIDKDGKPCTCVHKNMCDEMNVAMIDSDELDIRIDVDDQQSCPEKVEVCCKAPKDPPQEKPKPDSSILRIAVNSTDTPTILTDKDGEPCTCVPNNMCDEMNVAITDSDELEIRFGEGDEQSRTCQEKVEVCCKAPKEPPQEEPKLDSNLKKCGYFNSWGVGDTVLGGRGIAQYGEFPWVVALLDALNETYVGVGVLIHPQVVMTGAHVAYKYGAGKLKVRAGEWKMQMHKEKYEHQDRDVQEMYLHKDFQPKSLKNDVALLRLGSPLVLADYINMLCLPNQGENFDTSKDCVVNGWGKNQFGQSGSYAVILKRVEQDMVPHDRCNTLLQRTRLGPHFQLHSSFVCAGGEEGKDTCQGDGGAPLACPIGDDRFKLTGLVAWGIGCGQQDVPAVYAGVAQFRDWVDAQMNKWGYGVDTYSI